MRSLYATNPIDPLAITSPSAARRLCFASGLASNCFTGTWWTACFIIAIGCFLQSCHTRPASAEHSPKFEQYITQGEGLYAAHCSNCHQQSGTGLGRVYPPLNQSDFIENNFEEVICLIRNGRTGELKVNGKLYNQAMPATTLSDLEIAEIATYIYNSWGRSRGIIEVTSVSSLLQACDTLAHR
jgi:cytochrome c551